MRLLHLIAAEDPTQTHHWMWPEKAEIIYGGIASILILRPFSSSPHRLQRRRSPPAPSASKRNSTTPQIRGPLPRPKHRTFVAQSATFPVSALV